MEEVENLVMDSELVAKELKSRLTLANNKQQQQPNGLHLVNGTCELSDEPTVEPQKEESESLNKETSHVDEKGIISPTFFERSYLVKFCCKICWKVIELFIKFDMVTSYVVSVSLLNNC